HDVPLDQLVTGGFVALAMWIALLAGLLVIGARRVGAGTDEDRTLRLGCLGAVVGHIVEGVSGIETIVPFALFWILAGMLTAPFSSSAFEGAGRARRAVALWGAGLVAAAAIGCAAVAATTVWLLASMFFVRGIALAKSERFEAARSQFEQSMRLV